MPKLAIDVRQYSFEELVLLAEGGRKQNPTLYGFRALDETNTQLWSIDTAPLSQAQRGGKQMYVLGGEDTGNPEVMFDGIQLEAGVNTFAVLCRAEGEEPEELLVGRQSGGKHADLVIIRSAQERLKAEWKIDLRGAAPGRMGEMAGHWFSGAFKNKAFKQLRELNISEQLLVVDALVAGIVIPDSGRSASVLTAPTLTDIFKKALREMSVETVSATIDNKTDRKEGLERLRYRPHVDRGVYDDGLRDRYTSELRGHRGEHGPAFDRDGSAPQWRGSYADDLPRDGYDHGGWGGHGASSSGRYGQGSEHAGASGHERKRRVKVVKREESDAVKLEVVDLSVVDD
jgi:hypothetical protein